MVHLDRERVRELLRYVRWLERDAAEGGLLVIRVPITRSVLRRGCSISTAERLRSAVLARRPGRAGSRHTVTAATGDPSPWPAADIRISTLPYELLARVIFHARARVIIARCASGESCRRG